MTEEPEDPYDKWIDDIKPFNDACIKELLRLQNLYFKNTHPETRNTTMQQMKFWRDMVI